MPGAFQYLLLSGRFNLLYTVGRYMWSQPALVQGTAFMWASIPEGVEFAFDIEYTDATLATDG